MKAVKCAMSRPEPVQEQEQEKQAAKQCKWKASSKIRDAMVSGSPTDGTRAGSRTKKGYSNDWLAGWLARGRTDVDIFAFRAMSLCIMQFTNADWFQKGVEWGGREG